MEKKRLGRILIEAGVLKPEQLEEALEDQKLYGGRLGTILFEKSFITERDFFRTLTSKLGIPAVDFTKTTVPESIIKLVPEEMAFKHAVFPVGMKKTKKGMVLYLAMSDPTNIDIIEEVEFVTATKVEPALAMESTIRHILYDYYYNKSGKGSYRFNDGDGKDSKVDPEGPALKVENSRTRDPGVPDLLLRRDNESEPSEKSIEERVSRMQEELWILMDLLEEKGIPVKDELRRALNRT